MPTAIEEPGADLETGDIGYAPSGGPGGAIDAGDIGHDPFSSARDFLGGPQPSPAAPQAPPIPLPPTQPNYGVDIQSLPAPYQMTGEEAARRRQLEFIENVYNKLPAREAASVIEQATQLEGRLGYDEDLKAGVPPHEALAKWGPKLFHNAPAALLRALTPTQPFTPTTMKVGGRDLIQTSRNQWRVAPDQPGTGPLQAQPILDPDGNVVGWNASGAKHVNWNNNKGGVTARDQLMILRTQQQNALGKIKKFPATPAEKASNAQHLAELDRIGEELGKLYQGHQGKIKPAPPTQLREAGMTYMTPKGPHQWTGSHWTAPSEPDNSGDESDYPEVNTDTEE